MNNEISEILQNKLYISGISGSKNYPMLQSIGINMVVSILHFNPMLENDEFYKKSNIKCVFYYAHDNDEFSIRKYFDQFNDLINENLDKKILVHCLAGCSRSISLCASFILKLNIIDKKKKKYGIDRVLYFMKKKRDCSNPNDGFIKELKDYESFLKLQQKENMKPIDN
jgi:dual specificity MAP kinase phosphatase